MTDQTKALIDSIQNLNWFSNVGRPIGDFVARIDSWTTAVKQCRSVNSCDVLLECSNLFRETIFEKSKERYHSYRKLWDEIQPLVVEAVERIKTLPDRNAKSDKVHQSALVDLAYACMELEFTDIVPPKYFAERAKWYLAGHFPCGWEGDFPEGKLIVY